MKNKVKIEDLRQGDVVRAVIPNKGEHTFIVLEDYDPHVHVKCIHCCSFSSNPSSKSGKRFLSLDGCEIPDYFFEEHKDISYLRIDEEICLQRFLLRERLGNLKDHFDLWTRICNELSDVSVLASIELKGVCACKCLEESPYPPFYCTQEISHLSPDVVDQYKQYGCVSACPCCGQIIALGGGAYKCKNCSDNLMVIIYDFHQNRNYITEVVDECCPDSIMN